MKRVIWQGLLVVLFLLMAGTIYSSNAAVKTPGIVVSVSDDSMLSASQVNIGGCLDRPFSFSEQVTLFSQVKNEQLFFLRKFLPACKEAFVSKCNAPDENFRCTLVQRYSRGFYIYCLRQILV